MLASSWFQCRGHIKTKLLSHQTGSVKPICCSVDSSLILTLADPAPIYMSVTIENTIEIPIAHRPITGLEFRVFFCVN